MFPIPFNFPFRKKDGSMTTISQAISEGGGSYTLPTASETTKGGIKVGAGLTMDGETLKNTNPTPPTPYVLPTASDETLGGVKIGSNLEIENGAIKLKQYSDEITITPTTSGQPSKAIKRIGDIVTGNLWLMFTTPITNTDDDIVIGSVPNDFKPNSSRYFVLMAYSSDYKLFPVSAYISGSNNALAITFTTGNEANNIKYLLGSFAYPV